MNCHTPPEPWFCNSLDGQGNSFEELPYGAQRVMRLALLSIITAVNSRQCIEQLCKRVDLTIKTPNVSVLPIVTSALDERAARTDDSPGIQSDD